MGAGKTTAGALLADRLGWRFVDSDRVVEARAGMSVGEIFDRRGETFFRELEAAAVREAVLTGPVVLALGGGALEAAATRDFLAGLPDCVIVFLDGPLDLLRARCEQHNEGPVRPILADRTRLEERWQSRLPWYRQAHLTVDTSERLPQAVVERILLDLEERACILAESADSLPAGASGKAGARA